jgi:hypothetical protein
MALPANKRTIQVDMSPEAIAKRIKDAAELWRLGMSLKDAKLLGSAEELRGGRFGPEAPAPPAAAAEPS